MRRKLTYVLTETKIHHLKHLGKGSDTAPIGLRYSRIEGCPDLRKGSKGGRPRLVVGNPEGWSIESDASLEGETSEGPKQRRTG